MELDKDFLNVIVKKDVMDVVSVKVIMCCAILNVM